MKGKTVVVGMSGGVDSSVSALLLKEQGYHVIGMFMKNWEEENIQGQCLATKDLEDVIAVCEQLNIPYYSVNFAKEYKERVFNEFLEDLKKGFTPNPDVLCNREIKFKVFFDKAMQLGADYLATGHYCQTREGLLFKGKDEGKDQSYFLYTISQDVLYKVLFPIGHLMKSEVRQIARKKGLTTSEKKDSTGICFIGKRDFKTFLQPYIGYQPGNFETLDGTVIGKHEGIAYYTIGQRKGLGIGGPGKPWFVVGKDPQRNIVWIEQGEDHPALYRNDLIATDLSWVAGDPPLSLPFLCKAKIRYRHAEQPCLITKIVDGCAYIHFLIPQRAVTPRQSIVFYKDSICLGGGMIFEHYS